MRIAIALTLTGVWSCSQGDEFGGELVKIGLHTSEEFQPHGPSRSKALALLAQLPERWLLYKPLISAGVLWTCEAFADASRAHEVRTKMWASGMLEELERVRPVTSLGCGYAMSGYTRFQFNFERDRWEYERDLSPP